MDKDTMKKGGRSSSVVLMTCTRLLLWCLQTATVFFCGVYNLYLSSSSVVLSHPQPAYGGSLRDGSGRHEHSGHLRLL